MSIEQLEVLHQGYNRYKRFQNSEPDLDRQKIYKKVVDDILFVIKRGPLIYLTKEQMEILYQGYLNPGCMCAACINYKSKRFGS